MFGEYSILGRDTISTAVAFLKRTGLDMRLMRMGTSLLTGEPLSDGVRQWRRVLANPETGEAPTRDKAVPPLQVDPKDAFSFMLGVQSQRDKRAQTAMEPSAGAPHLLRILVIFRKTRASEPNDKVFAFLNQACDKLGIEVDYHASPQLVYRATAEAIIRDTKSLAILSQTQDSCDATIKDLPNWVPDFSARLRRSLLDNGGENMRFQAGSRMYDYHFELNNDGSLEVDSIPVDYVTRSPAPPGDEVELALSIMFTAAAVPPGHLLSEQKETVLSRLDTNETIKTHREVGRVEALWRTLICDSTRDSEGEFAAAPL